VIADILIGGIDFDLWPNQIGQSRFSGHGIPHSRNHAANSAIRPGRLVNQAVSSITLTAKWNARSSSQRSYENDK
jgi:hypothetical protein